MKISRDFIITTLLVVLVIALLLFIFFGCFSYNKVEHFDTSEKKEDEKEEFEEAAPSFDLTPKEKELFQDLRENKLSTEQITDLVKGGILTEQLVEKFLNQLDSSAEEIKADTKEAMSTPEVEGFASGGGMNYACAGF